MASGGAAAAGGDSAAASPVIKKLNPLAASQRKSWLPADSTPDSKSQTPPPLESIDVFMVDRTQRVTSVVTIKLSKGRDTPINTLWPDYNKRKEMYDKPQGRAQPGGQMAAAMVVAAAAAGGAKTGDGGSGAGGGGVEASNEDAPPGGGVWFYDLFIDGRPMQPTDKRPISHWACARQFVFTRCRESLVLTVVQLTGKTMQITALKPDTILSLGEFRSISRD